MQKALESWQETSLLVEQAAKLHHKSTIVLSDELLGQSATPISSKAIEKMIQVLRTRQNSTEAAIERLSFVDQRTIENIIGKLTSMIIIERIPEEVLQQIFIIACSSTECAFERDPTDPLIVIPSVCKRWRQVALDTVSLWSHIDVDLHRYTAASQIWRGDFTTTSFPLTAIHQPYRPLKTGLWLKRARNAPLDIHFRNNGAPESSPILSGLFNSYGSRIVSLVFSHEPVETVLETMLAACTQKGTPSALQTLVIYRGILYTRYNRFSFALFPLRSLTVLKLRHMCGSRSYLKMSEFLSFLSENPYLQELQVKITTITMDNLDDTVVVDLPDLEYFDLAEMSDDEVTAHLLSALHVGARELHMMINVTNDPNFLRATFEFFQRANIISLGLQEQSFEDDRTGVIDEYLTRLPKLRSLFVNTLDYHLLNSRTVTGDGGGPMNKRSSPQVLYLYWCSFNPTTREELKNMIQSLSLSQVTFCYHEGTYNSRDIKQILTCNRLIDADDPNGDMSEWLKSRVKNISLKLLKSPGEVDWHDVFDGYEIVHV